MKKNFYLFVALMISQNAFSQFITVWKTDNVSTGSSTATQIKIPTNTAYTYNYTVNWGDGLSNTYTTNTAQTHTYATAGTYTVSITGTFPAIQFSNGGDKLKLLSITQWGTGTWRSMESAFYGCTNLQGSIADAPVFALNTSLARMFRNCTKFNTSLNTWNTANVIDMSTMFTGATVFNGNIAAWNVAGVTDMSNMFSFTAAFNGNIGSWNVSAVTDMSNMFASAKAFNQNINAWNVGAVTNMYSMFSRTSVFNQPLNSWNVAAVTNMSSMFNGATMFNQPIGSWNVAAVTNMYSMFWGALAFNGNIGAWNVAAVTNMGFMFYTAPAFNQPIGTWNVGAVTNMSYMFGSASAFNQAVGSWNVTAVTDMSSMFYSALNFDQNIGAWNIANADISNMFLIVGFSLSQYDNILNAWNTAGYTNKNLGNAEPLRYCAGQAARTSLIGKGWTITGDTYSCINSEINLKGNNTSIANLDNTPSLTDFTDFGSQSVSSGTIVRTFTIENTGNGVLTLQGVVPVNIYGTNASDFIVTTQAATSVAANTGTTTFQITFTPSVSGLRTATISIDNNDSNENPYTFSIQGIGTTAVCSQVATTTQTMTWTGTLSNDWSNACNWSPNGVPSATNPVVINNVTNKPTVLNGTNAHAKSITNNSGAILTISTGAIFFVNN